MALATMQSPFATPGAPAPGTFDPTKIAQQMQTDPNVRSMFAQFFGDPASRQFVQNSGNVVNALARPDNPWTPGTSMVAAPSTSASTSDFSAASGPSGETGVAPGSQTQFTPGASLASRPPVSPATAAAGAPQPSGVPPTYANAEGYAAAHPEDVMTPARPVAPMDNVHGARKALMLAFLGLNKFGAGLAHQQDSYADQFLGREMNQQQAQAAYDASAPQLKHQAEEAAYSNYLGQEEKAQQIAQTGAQIRLIQAQTGNLALNPPGKTEFLKEIEDRRRTGADDPQKLFDEFSARAPYAHASPDEVANIINSTPENAPAFKIGPQGIREPITWHGQQWYGNEPNAPQQIKDAATAAAPVENKIHSNTLQAQAASRSNIVMESELGQKTKNLETGQKNAKDAVDTINDAASQQELMQNLLSGKVDPAGQDAAMWKMIGLEEPEGSHRISPQEVSGLEQLGGLSDRLKQKLLNWKQGDVFPSTLLPDIKQTADTLLKNKVKNANDQLQSNYETYGYKYPGTGAHGRLDEVQAPPATGASAGASGQQKVATTQHVADYAKQKGVSIDAATKEFQNAGYTIQ